LYSLSLIDFALYFVYNSVKNHAINCMACLVLEHLKNIVFDDYQDSIKESWSTQDLCLFHQESKILECCQDCQS